MLCLQAKILSFLFLALRFISIIFSCNNENKGKKDTVYVPSKLNIDSTNASEFANSFILDIYNSDTVSARSKIQIKYNANASFVSNLLANEDDISALLLVVLSQQLPTTQCTLSKGQ